MIERAAAVFVAFVFVDVFWAQYVLAAAARRPARAGMWAALIAAFSAICTLACVYDPRMILPAALGAFTGTFVSIRERAL